MQQLRVFLKKIHNMGHDGTRRNAIPFHQSFLKVFPNKKKSVLDSEDVLLTPAVWRSPVRFAFVWVRSWANLHSNFKPVQTSSDSSSSQHTTEGKHSTRWPQFGSVPFHIISLASRRKGSSRTLPKMYVLKKLCTHPKISLRQNT